jgi:hypothetical protein
MAKAILTTKVDPTYDDEPPAGKDELRGAFEPLARRYPILAVSTLRRPRKKSDIPQLMMPRQQAPAMLALTRRR